MKSPSPLLLLAPVCALLMNFQGRALSAPEPSSGSPTNAIVEATNKFLATLSDEQRGKVLFDFQDSAQRKHWSNLPNMAVQRAGLSMGSLAAPQREAVMKVLAAALSPQGLEKTLQIMEGDEKLKTEDRGGPRGPGGPNDRVGPGPGGPGDRGGPGPGGPGDRGGPGPGGRGNRGAIFGKDLYFISFMGQPSATKPWMIQFGGHHLGLNITLVGEQSTLAPSHVGVQPALYELEGKTIRPLGHETDKAFALLSSLDDAQQKQAILGFEMHDLVLGPGRDGKIIQPEGIKGSSLTEKQREMLLDLVSEWTGIMNEAVAKSKLSEIKNNLAETWFAWSGPTEKGGAAYFRIQGPTVIIEYAPQRLGGDPTKHIHTMYRDPTNDYGAKWWKP